MASAPKQQQAQPVQSMQASATPPPAVNLQTQGWGNMGVQYPPNPMGMGTPQTGIGTAPPPWATGHFAMPWWGQQAPNVGMAMQQQANPQAYQAAVQAQQAAAAPPPPPPPQAAPQAPVAPPSFDPIGDRWKEMRNYLQFGDAAPVFNLGEDRANRSGAWLGSYGGDG